MVLNSADLVISFMAMMTPGVLNRVLVVLGVFLCVSFERNLLSIVVADTTDTNRTMHKVSADRDGCSSSCIRRLRILLPVQVVFVTSACVECDIHPARNWHCMQHMHAARPKYLAHHQLSVRFVAIDK